MPTRQAGEECRLLLAELIAAQKAQLHAARERERDATVPFVERLKKMSEAEFDEIAKAQSSSKAAQVYGKLRQHKLTCHAGQFF